MRVGVPKEVAASERRVALVPDAVARLVKGGFAVAIERGAGTAAACPDEAYKAAGAVIADRAAVLGQADIVLQVQAPASADVSLYREGGVLVALLQPGSDAALIQQLARRKLTAFSLLLLPRITRAQPMDVLSSQATVAGYKAVLLAATATGRFLPMLVTAAGTIPAARVLVLGVGVAGLQAIATARRLGAIVSAFDVRPAVKEQVQSLGAQFLEMAIEEHAETAGGYAKELSEDTHRKELAFLAAAVKDADIVITTAAIPGKKAPILITAAAVEGMKPGTVVVDLAAETGGNCELTEAGSEIVRHGVVILGPVNLPSTLPLHASQMYAKNLSAFLGHVVQDGKLRLDFEDPIIRDTCVTHAGEVRKT
jgi:NAD(P) transhydrogenase subunit alpha